MFKRYGISSVAGVVITVVLLYVMQSVIAFDKNPLNEGTTIKIPDFAPLIEKEDIEVRRTEVEPPPLFEELPTELLPFETDKPGGYGEVEWEIKHPVLDIPDQKSGWGPRDGDYMPWFKPEPEYPAIALQRGIEGYVIVQFDVTETGTVEKAVVLEAEPLGIFDRSALRAAIKFKYKPKILDGEPVRVTGVKNRITYELVE